MIGFVSLLLTAMLALQAPVMKVASLEKFQTRLEAKLAETPNPHSFQVLSNTPAIYVPNVGLVLSNVVNLSYLESPSPFRGPYTDKELAVFKERKVQHLPILEKGMREVMADTAAAPEIDNVPPTERIILGVTLFYFTWEDSAGLPRQIVMSAEKGKLLQARRDKIDLATVIQETKL